MKAWEKKTSVSFCEIVGIVASGKLQHLDTSIYETNAVNQIIQVVMCTHPQLPPLPVTFDATEAERQVAQKHNPLEMAKTLFPLMILGPWHLADVQAMHPLTSFPEEKHSIMYLRLRWQR